MVPLLLSLSLGCTAPALSPGGPAGIGNIKPKAVEPGRSPSP